ncbi:hypothetical protein [Pediococcus pentosaceus]|jgi:hypothetical protein|uniref:hypothetical protein n=1 Tax=Pediococcus pentosaceus TaxID=1255 RepID=UPI000A4D6A25|nr:hypothetical protein [Pediococcus pentosaceus]ASC08820.1 hypothetical protein S100194_01309 [Pediococcus pentosaceus]MBF7111782.1 hypothetical protein [Pediococcus pentosaceus]MBF7113464.1 hypothetical protein [Pediococcus pentosaceus]MBF7118513.1 hypothetical protein [Pediococcus pentosaceus]MBF7134751.1 hypothetical protein [Pediococcus pentosaceus]
MDPIKFIIILMVIVFGVYFVSGGWAENLGELYRNYKQSNLTFSQFLKSIIKKGKK